MCDKKSEPIKNEEWVIMRNSSPGEIRKFMNEVFDIIEIRAKVGKVNDIKFVVYTNEQNHNLSHVHAKHGEHEISISIETCDILAGNLSPKQTRIAQEWVKNNRAKLRNDWKAYAISATSAYTKSGLD